MKEKTNEGNMLAKTERPNINFDWVNEYTTQLTPVFCIHVPTSEIDWPVKYSR
jgi:hypothetical protein